MEVPTIIIIAGSVIAAGIILYNLRGIFSLIGDWLRPLPQKDREVLGEHSRYYLQLEKPRRKEFEERVKEILFEKEWKGMAMQLDREKRVRIAAALVQLTFGLERLLLLHFRRIVVFPDDYVDRTTGKKHQGGVRPATGTITLSWKHFEQGYDDPHDARNVGLHELAHALWIENGIGNQEHDFLDRDLIHQWQDQADQEISRIRSGEDRMFRPYAATNKAEFFAVAVEYFFEQPQRFLKQLPHLYGLMCRMLKQDPAAALSRAV